jgi:RNA polymerase sigma-70 factor (ECF subfamily)
MNDLEHIDTARLIVLSREGDAAAMGALVRAYESRIYRLALSMLNDPAEADEATQDTFSTALQRLTSFRGEASFATWLYAIALNVCRGRLRQRRRRERLAVVLHALRLTDQSHERYAEQVAIEHETDRTVWQALHALNDKQREAILLRYYHDLKLNDIAQVVGVSERTIRTWLHQAHEQLRAELKDSVE